MGQQRLIELLPEGSFSLNEPLSRHTTVGIGGPADIWYEAKTREDLLSAIKLAGKCNVPVTVLGWGSNILVSDKGIRGLVIRNDTKNIEITDEYIKTSENDKRISPRWQSDKNKGTFKYEFNDLNYDESEFPRINVKVDSGVSMPFLINYFIHHGITGLQWYAGIPGTVGGAIFNNIHGGTHFFHEVLESVEILTKERRMNTIRRNDLEYEYDKSRFHASGEIILGATLQLFKGEKDRAKATAEEWAKRKKIQPRNSPGCVFKNITNEEKEKLGFPTSAVGYIVEHILKMGDFRIGDAVVSTAHHNFIVNAGRATAADYLAVIREIQMRAKSRLKITLEPEIFLLGEW